jgi:hypothetical protein
MQCVGTTTTRLNMMKGIAAIVARGVLLAVVLASSMSISAAPFDKGSQSLSLVVGSGSSFRENYIIIGGGYGYYLLDGLELGIDAQAWVGGTPKIYKVSPQVKYVFNVSPQFKPYAGAFYRRTYTEGLDDLNSTGYRVGLIFMGVRGTYFGAGYVFEDYQDCSTTIFRDCSTSYPEFLFSISF